MKTVAPFVLCGLLPLPILAQSFATAPVGASTIAAPANHDTVLPLPLARSAVASGSVSAVSGSDLGVVSSQTWAAGDFVGKEAHYLRFKTGRAAGRYYTVTANTADQLTVDWNGETPAASPGDEFQVIPYWTLATLFPASEAGRAFVPRSARDAGTLLYIRDSADLHGAPPRAFFFQSGAWRMLGDAANADCGSIPLAPDSVLAIRNHGVGTAITTTGGVHTVPASVVINAPGGTDRLDNELSLGVPASVTLAQSNLVASGAFEASPAAESRRDELRIYEGFGHASRLSATYYFCGGAWRKVGATPEAAFDDTRIFTPGTRVVLNKAGTGGAPRTTYWTQPRLVN